MRWLHKLHTSLGACDTATLMFLLPVLPSSTAFSLSRSLLPELLVGASASGSVLLAVGMTAAALLMPAECLRGLLLRGVPLPVAEPLMQSLSTSHGSG